MHNYLHISELRIETYIGVYPWEQRILQPLLLDIKIPMDFSVCNDQIETTLDYAMLCEHITQFVASNKFALIETVAKQVIQEIKKTFQVKELTLSVSKPHAVKNAGNVSVIVHG
jgi:dihydroneopterin aldolase